MTKGTLHQEVVRRLLLTGAQHRLERVINKLHPADIAELFGALSPGELRGLIDSAIEALPEHYRAVFVMRAVEGMSTAESAECLDITEETAKTRLHRARTLLRDTLYQRAGIESAAAFSFEAPRCDRVVAAVFEQIEAIDQSSLPRPK